MNQGKKNSAFLAAIGIEAKSQILATIAERYRVTSAEIFEEVTDDEAEHLLDYMGGSERAAASVLMQKYGYR